MRSLRRARPFVIAALACVTAIVWNSGGLRAASGPEPPFARRVIRAAEIEETGVTRLGDLLLFIDGWAPSTVDGFTWQGAPRGLDSYQTAAWTVMVDGIPIDAAQFGVIALNRIPVYPADIDSVEIVQTPGLEHGRFAGGGLIHVHTREERPGFALEAAGTAGNEAGDPGPWAYTPAATPNVDRVGPTYAFRGSYGGGRVSAAVSYLNDKHYATDEAVRARTFGIAAGEYPQLRVSEGSGRLAGRFLGGRHEAFAAYSRFEDFFFFKPYGREIPVVSRLGTGGLSGRIPLGERSAARYRVTRTDSKIGYRPNAYALDFDWRVVTWTAGAGIDLGTAALRHSYGIEYERKKAETGYDLTRDFYELIDLHGAWEWSSFGKLDQRVSAVVTQGQDDGSFAGAAGARWRVGDSHRMDVAASYEEMRPERDGRIWYWRDQGYRFLEDAGVDVDAGVLAAARRFTLDLGWAADLHPAVSGSASIYYRDFSDLSLESQRFAFDSDTQAFSGPIRLIGGRSGGVGGAEAIVDIHPSAALGFRTAYRFEDAMSGDALFRDVWEAVPRHLARQTVRVAPVRNLALWARVSWASGSRWRDYDDAEAQSGGAYSASLDDAVTFDAAVTKWFWHRRVRGHVVVRDLFGWGPRYHPIGASFDTTVFAGLDLVFGAPAGKEEGLP